MTLRLRALVVLGCLVLARGASAQTTVTPVGLPVCTVNGQVPSYSTTTSTWSCVSLSSTDATTALDNLASVAINAALVPGTAGALAIGSATKPWSTINFAGTSGTPGTNNFSLTGASSSGTRQIVAPDADTKLPIATQVLTFTGPTAPRSYALPDGSVTLVDLASVQSLSNKTVSGYLAQGAAPTITSGFGTSPAIDAGYASSFIVTIGSGGTGSTGIIALPTAAVGWVCMVQNIDNPIATTSATVPSAYSTSSVTLTNYTIATGVALAWTAGHHLRIACFPH